MATITVQAVYHKGALRPKKKLDLPEDALVEVQVTPLDAPVAGATESLFGAFPELKEITDADLRWGKQLWEQSQKKQQRTLGLK